MSSIYKKPEESFIVNLVSVKGTPAFLGKTCYEILAEEFCGFLMEADNENSQVKTENCTLVQIEECYPLITKTFIAKVINFMHEFSLKQLALEGLFISMEKCKHNPMETPETAAREIEGDVKAKISLLSFEQEMIKAQGTKNIIKITQILQAKIIEKHIENGVFIFSPQTTYIDYDVKIASGVTIYQNNFICKNSSIASGVVLMPNNNICGSEIASGVKISASTLENAKVGKNTQVGPNAYLRPNAQIGENCRIGDFVEIKNASIGDGTKVAHLSYVGDATVGQNVNIGCGVVFVNYNGKSKNHTKVGNNCFIGSNCNIVAPVTIENDCFVAAGTTLTKDLQADSFCIGRCRETIKEKRAKDYLGKH